MPVRRPETARVTVAAGGCCVPLPELQLTRVVPVMIANAAISRRTFLFLTIPAKAAPKKMKLMPVPANIVFLPVEAHVEVVALLKS